jgi:hypothetical protein
MPAKKKAARRSRVSAPARKTKSRLQKTWDETQAAITSAEATVEKKVKALAKRSGVDTRQAAEAVKAWSVRLDRERKKALKQIEGRLAVLQTRAKKEQRAVTRTVETAVQRTLAALNIPSRHEVHELTRRVDLLSRKIDGFRR